MTYVLIPGAGCTSWHWHPFTGELRRRGHQVIAPDLPCDDPAAGLREYADTVVNAVGEVDDAVVVAHSLGGFTAALVGERLPVREVVLVAAMVPQPGERVRDWWDNTGYEWVEEDVDTFFHDLAPEDAAEARSQLREQADRPMADPCDFTAWPEVPIQAVIGRDDLLFPAPFLRRVTEDRLGITPIEMPGAHFPMLGHPAHLADLIGA